MLKRIFLSLISLCILLVAGLLAAPSFVDWKTWQNDIEAIASDVTGLAVHLDGDMQLSFFPSPRIIIEDFNVNAPKGSVEDDLLRVKRAEVHIAWLPLVQGEFHFDYISLIRPVINLEVLSGQRPNWQIQAMSKEDGKPEKSTFDTKRVRLNGMSIENGVLRYRDKQKKQDIILEDIHADLKAGSMSGPYTAEGSFTYAEHTLNMSLYSGLMNKGNSFPFRFEAQMDDGILQAAYTGVLGHHDGLNFQGELDLSARNAVELISLIGATHAAEGTTGKAVPVSLRGIATYEGGRFEYTNLKANVLDADFNGKLGFDTKKNNLALDLNNAKPLDFAEFTSQIKHMLPVSSSVTGNEGHGSFPILLPQSMSLPRQVKTMLNASLTELIWRNNSFKDVVISVSHQKDKELDISISAGSLSGGGSGKVDAILSFDSMSAEPDSLMALYADPKLTGKLALAVDDGYGLLSKIKPAHKFVEPLSIDALKDIRLAGAFTVLPDVYHLRDLVLNVAGSKAAGNIKFSQKSKRPLLDIAVVVDHLVADHYIQAPHSKAAKAEQKKTEAIPVAAVLTQFQTISLPVDMNMKASVSRLDIKDKQYQNVHIDGALTEQLFALKNFTFVDRDAYDVSLTAKIDNRITLDGIDVTGTVSITDFSKTLASYNMPSDFLKKESKSAKLSFKAAGNAESLDSIVNLYASGFEVQGQGILSDIQDKPGVQNLAVRAKHPAFGDAVGYFVEDFEGGTALNEKPLDIYFEVTRTEDEASSYKISDIQALLGPMSVKGDVALTFPNELPYVKGAIQLNDINTAHFMSSAKVTQGQGNQGAGAKWSRNALDTAWMHDFNFDMGVTAKSLRHKNWHLQKPAARISMLNGTLRIDEMDATLYDGKMGLTAVVKSSGDAREPISVEVETKLVNVKAGPLSKAMTGKSKGHLAGGTISSDIAINTVGLSPSALVFDMNGTGQIEGQNIVVNGMDLGRISQTIQSGEKTKKIIAGLVDESMSGGQTAFNAAMIDFTIDEGIVNFDEFKLTGDTANIGAAGRINLPRWTIDLEGEVAIQRPAGTPPFGFVMNGSLDNPAKSFAKGTLEKFLADQLSRSLEKMLQKQLEKKLGVPAAPSEDEADGVPAEKSGDPMRGLLENLLKQ